MGISAKGPADIAWKLTARAAPGEATGLPLEPPLGARAEFIENFQQEDGSVIVPEVLRTPGYPAFVAVMYRLFGTSQLAVVIPQILLCGLLSLVVYRIARYMMSPHAATWA